MQEINERRADTLVRCAVDRDGGGVHRGSW